MKSKTRFLAAFLFLLLLGIGLTGCPTNLTVPPATPPPSGPPPCSNNGVFGDANPSASTLSVNPILTQLQRYNLAQDSTVQGIYLDPAGSVVVRVGLYDDWSGLYPNNLLYASGPVTLSGGLASIPVPNVALTAGNYWLACQVISGNSNLYSASGSTAWMVNNNAGFPSTWAPCLTGSTYSPPIPTCTMIPRYTTNQVVLYAEYCY